MKLRILIRTSKVPILYRHRVISLIKESLKLSDLEYKNFLYNSNIPKAFTFNLSFPKGFTIRKEPLQIDNYFTPERFPKLQEIETFYLPEDSFLSLWISSADYRFIISLYSGLRKLKIFKFSTDTTMLVNGEKINWEIRKILPINEKLVTKKRVILKTCSPILVEKNVNGKKKPVLFTESDFEKELNLVMNKILNTLRGYGLREYLSFKGISMNIQKVKHTLKEFREKTGIPYMTLTGSRGIFQLQGHPEDINYIVKVGIGNRSSQGFGMVEVLE